jgi:hypothetical protein
MKIKSFSNVTKNDLAEVKKPFLCKEFILFISHDKEVIPLL